MKKLVGIDNLPHDVKVQIDSVTAVWQKHLGQDLVGVYLHGSIALNAFCPESGDIDILVVVKDSISIEKKLAIAKDMVSLDGNPRPLEMSAITERDAFTWKTPGNCVFHYSDYWTDKYVKRFADPAEEVYVVDQEFPDADVTSYIKLLHQSGIVLYGKPVAEIFAEVSDEDFWNAISAEAEEYEFDNLNERYFASNILILGRILSFKIEHKILSKYDAGLWMIEYVPEALKYLPERAMKVWYEGEKCEFPAEDLERLKDFLVAKIIKR